MIIIDIITKLILIPALAPLVIGFVRKIKARLQNRRGASVIQPYYDLKKLFSKNEVISNDASWVFLAAPYIIFAATVVAATGIPFLLIGPTVPFLSDFLVIIYLLALSTFFLALAGIDVGSAFGGFGSSREMTIAAITEGVFVFSLLPAIITARTTNVIAAAGVIQSLGFGAYYPLLIAIPTIIIVMLAETKRFPFDNPSTHLELTMVHEAMILEYSGKRLALVEWTAYTQFLFFIILGSNLFVPWGLAKAFSPLALGISLVSVAVKVMIVAGGVAVLESIIAKYRYFRLPDILLTAFILGIISLLVVNY